MVGEYHELRYCISIVRTPSDPYNRSYRVINTMRRLLVEDDCITSEDQEALEKMNAFVQKHEPTYLGVKMVAGTLATLVRIPSFLSCLPLASMLSYLPLHACPIQMSTGTAPTRKLSKTIPIGAPPPILPRANPTKKIKFLDMDPLEVARQLTLMESELFGKIRGSECLARAEGGNGGDDNIKAVIIMSNKVRTYLEASQRVTSRK